jgi:hypothetical protein
MSAPAPAIDPKSQPIVVVRLSDPAALAAYVSFAFAFALALFPASFPAVVSKNWLNGHLILTLALGSCLLNAVSYLRVAHIVSRRPGLLASAALGFFTVLTVVGLTVIETKVLGPWIIGLPNPQPHVTEEILAHTYFTLMSALFFPFLAVRFLQSFRLSHTSNYGNNRFMPESTSASIGPAVHRL